MHPEKKIFRLIRAFVGVVLGLIAGVLGGDKTAYGQGNTVQIVAGGLHVPAQAVDAGPLPASQPVQFAIVLKLSDGQAKTLSSYLKDLTDPSALNYRKWLRATTFANQFGPASDQVNQVSTWLVSQGLTVDSMSASNLLINVHGSVAQVQSAFGVPMESYQLAGATYFAAMGTPSVPSSMGGLIAGVEGLSNFHAPSIVATSDSGESMTVPPGLAISALSSLLDANSAAVVSMSGEGRSADWYEILQQANAQGVTVLVAPHEAATPYETAIASSALAKAVAGNGLRPEWQVALGLPADNLRDVSDFVSSTDFTSTVLELIAKAGTRVGNINPRTYQIAPEPGVFTQADSAPAGTWVAATGLGAVNTAKFVRAFAVGTSGTNTSITGTTTAPTHGQPFDVVVTVQSQAGGATPTGTVTVSNNVTTGLATLSLDSTVNPAKATYTAPGTLDGGTYGYSAVYNGDSTYATSTTPVNFTVQVQPEQASISATLSGSTTIGSTATIHVTVSAPSGVGQPSGTVYAQGQGTTDTTKYPGTLSSTGNGIATATISYPVSQAGTFTIQVTCTPTSPSFTCFSPGSVSLTSGKMASTTALATNPSTPVGGSSLSMTATVTGGSGTPTGAVSFYDGTSLLASGAVNSVGVATGTATLSAASSHSITAIYQGDTTYSGSTSTAISSSTTGSTGSTASTTVLTSAPNPLVAGASAKFTATVSGTGGTPTGTVTFKSNSTSIGTGTLSGGVATLTTTLSTTAAQSITAVYGGDTSFATSTSNALSTGATGTTATTTSLTASAYTGTYGGNISFTSAVTATAGSTVSTTPSGTITFTSDKDGVIGTSPLSSVGSTTFSYVGLSGGIHHITATYGGDPTFAASTSLPITVTITPATATLSATISPTSIAYGSTATVTATVTLASGTASGGTINVVVKGTTYTGTVSGGIATIVINTPPPGTYSAVVSCVTNTSYTCSPASVTSTLTVTKGNTITTLIANPTSAKAGEPITLTATIVPFGGSTDTATFTGNVIFYDGSRSIAMPTVIGNTATTTVTFNGAATHSLTAVYAGDTSWFGSTSTAISVMTSLLNTTTVLTSNVSGNALAGMNVILAATVTTSDTTTLAPATGTVTFYDTFGASNNALGTSPLVPNGLSVAVATFSTTGLQAGTHMISAVYRGDTNYKTSKTSPIGNLALTFGDYTISFVTANPIIKQGSSAPFLVQVGGVNGFTGAIALNCTPPPGTGIACSFNPTTVNGSGVATLTVSTTAATSSSVKDPFGWRTALGGVAMAAMLWVVTPRRRRLAALLGMLVMLAGVGAGGCASSNVLIGNSTGGQPGAPTQISGTPLGTQTLTIVAAGSEGNTFIRHTYSYNVSVQ